MVGRGCGFVGGIMLTRPCVFMGVWDWCCACEGVEWLALLSDSEVSLSSFDDVVCFSVA